MKKHRISGSNFLARLSTLHSMCTKEHFEEKKLLEKTMIVLSSSVLGRKLFGVSMKLLRQCFQRMQFYDCRGTFWGMILLKKIVFLIIFGLLAKPVGGDVKIAFHVSRGTIWVVFVHQKSCFLNHFRTSSEIFGETISAGSSTLHSACLEENFEEKIYLKKL